MRFVGPFARPWTAFPSESCVLATVKAKGPEALSEMGWAKSRGRLENIVSKILSAYQGGSSVKKFSEASALLSGGHKVFFRPSCQLLA